MSKDFLQLLLEGSDCGNNDDVETNPDIDKEIEENWLPMSTIIENAFAAADMEVIAALETYEMACIVGGVQVVSEGLDQADANAILMEAANGFFTKIKDTAKKIKDWFVSIFKKITDKFTVFSRDLSKKEQKLRPDFDKAWAEKKGNPTYKGSIISPKKVVQVTHEINEMARVLVDAPVKYFSNSLDKIEESIKSGKDPEIAHLIEKPAGYTHNKLMEAITGKESNNYDFTVADCTKEFKAYIGYEDDPKEIVVSNADVEVMRSVINLSAKTICDADKVSVKYITNLADSTIKFLNKIEADSTKYPETNKMISAITQRLNTLSGSLASLMNTKVQIVTSAAKSYLGWMKSIAGGKADSGEDKGDGKSTATESYDMSYLFEFSEFDDAVTESEDALLEMFEWTNIKAVKEFFGSKRKEAGDLTKEANRAFKKGDYKAAKDKYKKALPIWKEILKNIAKVPEKEPGKGSNNWMFLVPFINLVPALVLSYAADSTLKYVPEIRDTVDVNRVSKKVKEITRTGSVTKKNLLESVEAIIDYVEFQIKACDKPDGIIVEAMSPDAAELLAESVDAIVEAMEGEGCDDPDDNDDDEGVEEGTDAFDLAMGFLQ